MKTTKLYFSRAVFNWHCWNCGNSWELLEYNDKGWTIDGINRIKGTPKKIKQGLEIVTQCKRCGVEKKVIIDFKQFFPWVKPGEDTTKGEWARVWAKLQKKKKKYEKKQAKKTQWVRKEGTREYYDKEALKMLNRKKKKDKKPKKKGKRK